VTVSNERILKIKMLSKFVSKVPQGQLNQGNAKLGQVSQNVNAKLSKLTNNASPPTQAQQSQENPQLGRRPQNVFCKSCGETVKVFVLNF